MTIGIAARMWFIGQHGKEWFEANVIGRFGPITIVALLLTLVLIFAFQAESITGKLWHVILIAIPILLQVYLNASLAYGSMRWLKVPYSVAAPGALIGASNFFFELAVATAIALFGAGAGYAPVTPFRSPRFLVRPLPGEEGTHKTFHAHASFGFSATPYRSDQALSDLLAILDDRIESEGVQVGLPDGFLHQMWGLCNDASAQVTERVWLEMNSSDQPRSKARVRELTYHALLAVIETSS